MTSDALPRRDVRQAARNVCDPSMMRSAIPESLVPPNTKKNLLQIALRIFQRLGNALPPGAFPASSSVPWLFTPPPAVSNPSRPSYSLYLQLRWIQSRLARAAGFPQAAPRLGPLRCPPAEGLRQPHRALIFISIRRSASRTTSLALLYRPALHLLRT